jgi:hypothetical protein
MNLAGIFKHVAIVSAFAMMFMCCIIFLTAYGSPEKATAVYINNVGEADFELPFVLLAATAGGYYVLRIDEALPKRRARTTSKR